jgi:PAS domain S-box-containing protein
MKPASPARADLTESEAVNGLKTDVGTGASLQAFAALGSDPINILLVDDEPKNLLALETVLADPGYRLICAHSADEALLALVKEEFALLVLDIQMPGMNGFELAHMVKQRKKTSSVPIIFLTAYFSEDEHVMEGYSSGAVDFLHKPINATILRSKVATFATLHRKTRQAELANQILSEEINERRRAQETLRELNADLEERVRQRTAESMESEERFRTLADDMPHLVWETDPRGVLTFQNGKWREYTGLSAGNAADFWGSAIHPQDAPAALAEWARALDAAIDYNVYCRLRHASDGSYRWFHIKAAPVCNNDGALVRWVGTCTDVHEQRKAEEALIEADRRKDEFLAMLGHELRNPLAAIRHAISINDDPAGDPAARRWAQGVIDRQSSQLSRMVDDLLDVERINRGRIELRIELVDLEQILLRAAEAVRPMLEQKRHAFELKISASPMHVNGDATRLEQVFVNLLGNAVKYTPEGGRIRLIATPSGGEAEVSIEDNGIGIAPALLPHVFDLFTQGETSIDRAQGGLGIGLTVVRSLIEMHGGTVSVKSGGSQAGATFCVRLPLTLQDSGSQPVVPAVHQDELPAGLRILIVDDHVDTAQALGLLLQRRKCDVCVTHDGPSGIVAARDFNPQVLLLDLGLPGLSGYEMVGALRGDAQFRNAFFVAISGYAQDADRAKAIAAGFDHHCAKPLDLPFLMEVIRARFATLASS